MIFEQLEKSQSSKEEQTTDRIRLHELMDMEKDYDSI